MKLSDSAPLKIGTRKSPLALVQTRLVLNELQAIFPQDPAIQNAMVIPVTTTGDRITDRLLREIGGKGLFARELEQALLAGEIDVAVHSLKDMETRLPTGLTLAATLAREDVRDVMVSVRAVSFHSLPAGSRLGTCAPRRMAQIMRLRPDLVCVPIRGNVDTRIRRLHEGWQQETRNLSLDAIVLAFAGLKRLGRQAEATYIFPESEMLPAAGQGAITLECCEDNKRILSYLYPLNHQDTERCVTAERALVLGLNGSCRTPIGAHATILANGKISLEAFISSFSGNPLYHTVQVGDDPFLLGQSAADMLKDQFEPGFWEQVCVF